MSMSLRILVLGVLFSIAVIGDCLAGKPTGTLSAFGEVRSWSDASGSFDLSAAMTETDGTTVKLRKSNGDVIPVPLSRLSSGDQAFVKAFLSAEKALGGKPSNPFDVAPIDSSDAGSMKSGASPEASGTGTPGDIPMRNVSKPSGEADPINFGSMPWNAGRVTPINIAPQANRQITLPLEKEFFAKLQLKVAGANPVCFVDVYLWGRGGKQSYSNFGKVAMTDRKPVALASSGAAWKIMAVSPDARTLACVNVENAFDKGNVLAIFDVTSDGVSGRYQFTAGEGSFGEVRWVGFLSGNRLATLSQKNTLTIWSLEQPRAIRQFKCRNFEAQIGGNSDLIALTAPGRVSLLSGKTYEAMGVIEVEGEGTPKVGFSPDGRWLATSMPYMVSVYSLDNGEMVRSIPVSSATPSSVEWIDNEHVMLGRDLLCDIKRGMAVWSYRAPDNAKSWGGSLYSIVQDRRGRESTSTLVSVKIPHAAVETAIGKVSPNELFDLQEGATYSIDMRLNGMPGNQVQEVRSGLQARLAANGWKESSNTTTRVVVKLEQGEPKTEEYARSMFRFSGPFGPTSGPSTKVTFRPWIHTISITKNGAAVFALKRVRGAASGITLKDGESIQQAVLRTVKPDPSFFTKSIIPAKIIKPKYRKGFGTSSITSKGLQ
ncbi:MAG: SHD1 domain-containing protein [Planctomycetota bacterium]